MTSTWSFSSLFLKYESDELEKSVYQDYDSDSDVPEELKQDYVDEQTGDAPLKRSVPSPLVLDHSDDRSQLSARPYIQVVIISTPSYFKCMKGS